MCHPRKECSRQKAQQTQGHGMCEKREEGAPRAAWEGESSKGYSQAGGAKGARLAGPGGPLGMI